MFFIIVAGLFGLIFGSFFNVVILRLPKKESLGFPASHCPHCKRPIKPWENIPVFSFVFLGGKCAGCKGPISIMYPIVEALTGICGIVLYLFFIIPHSALGLMPWQTVTLCFQTIVLLLLIPISFIDMRHFIIPDILTLPGLVLGIMISFLPGPPSPLQCLLGIAAGGGSLFLIGYLGELVFKKGEAMGGGDVKLMALCGAFFGWEISFIAIFIAALVGSLYGIILFFKGTLSSQNNKIPFGPFLAIGIWMSVLWGNVLIHAYIGQMDNLFG